MRIRLFGARTESTDSGACATTMLWFVLGGALASAAVVVERSVHHGHVYREPRDALLHLAVAWLFGMAAGAILGVPSAAFVAHWRRRSEPARRRFLARSAALVGFVAGAGLYVAVIVPSKYGGVLHPVLGAVVTGAGTGAAASGGAAITVRVLERHRALLVGSSFLLAAGIAWTDLHTYLRSYGNVHVVAAVATGFLAGLCCAAVLYGSRRVARWWYVVLFAGLVAAVHAGTAEISMSARSAVLEFGGGEKLAIQHVLWPLFDHDGDGHAGGFWGTDCDDADPSVAPEQPPHLTPALACERVPTSRVPEPAAAGQGQPKRSVIWIVIDTWRADTPHTIPPVLNPFLRLSGFRSCGSRTHEVVQQLIGTAGCAPAPDVLPRTLRESGYAVRGFSQYDFLSEFFDHSEVARTGRELAEAARRWIEDQAKRGDPYFAFVHFKGGHAPYEGSGRTERERYEASVAAALEHAATLVEAAGTKPVIVVMGDHGEEFGEHGGYTHASSLYEEVLDTHTYIRAQGWPSGIEPGHLSCADLRGVIHRALEGSPFRFEPSKQLFATLDSPRGVHGGISRTVTHALRFDATWKVVWKPYTDIWELYELRTDPRELHNLADAQPQRLRLAAAMLFAAVDRCGAANNVPVRHPMLVSKPRGAAQ